MHKTIALALATGITVATLPGISQSALQSRSTPIFIANEHDEKEYNERMRHQRGEHCDTVVGTYTRRCTSLDGQFKHLRARVGAGSREASALYEQGMMHCHAGDRLQGIGELSEAIRRIGRIPRVEL